MRKPYFTVCLPYIKAPTDLLSVYWGCFRYCASIPDKLRYACPCTPLLCLPQLLYLVTKECRLFKFKLGGGRAHLG